MTQPGYVFIDRRKGNDRRLQSDPCQNLPLDLYHRMRRKSSDRRSPRRSLSDDYYAFVAATRCSTAAGSEPDRRGAIIGRC